MTVACMGGGGRKTGGGSWRSRGPYGVENNTSGRKQKLRAFGAMLPLGHPSAFWLTEIPRTILQPTVLAGGRELSHRVSSRTAWAVNHCGRRRRKERQRSGRRARVVGSDALGRWFGEFALRGCWPTSIAQLKNEWGVPVLTDGSLF